MKFPVPTTDQNGVVKLIAKDEIAIAEYGKDSCFSSRIKSTVRPNDYRAYIVAVRKFYRSV